MESILLQLGKAEIWEEYWDYKIEKAHLHNTEEKELARFIKQKEYQQVSDKINSQNQLSIPEKRLINKIGTSKQRLVYSFPPEENQVLKLLAYLLYQFDELQPEGCYSFRRGYGAHRAINTLIRTANINDKWVYKLDIHDYFNSISIPLLLPILKKVLTNDLGLYKFLESLLLVDEAYYQGELIKEKRGVMAGTPIAPFLANLYLSELDEYFVSRHISYARYSDDIILFADDEESLMTYKKNIEGLLSKYQLKINTDKERIIKPQDTWEFLGFSYQKGIIDLSRATRDKLKAKIRRKARSLRRWMLRRQATPQQTMRVMIRNYNRKFFENSRDDSLTWSRWFFPLLNSDVGLKEIDAYLQQYIRYIATGKHRKKNYTYSYQQLKELGYRSLVNEYYRQREKNREDN